jgi:clathrin heavy chain
MNIPKLMRIC